MYRATKHDVTKEEGAKQSPLFVSIPIVSDV